MKRQSMTWFVVACVAVLMVPANSAIGDDVLAGIDLWETPGGANSLQDFANQPIPADFFDPGSDPFDGVIPFVGEPLGAPGIGDTDTIVERLADAILPGVGSVATVPIRIVALSLISESAITVTFNGGQNPELWDVRVCLSSTQSAGSITIRHDDPLGGTYTSSFPIQPKFVFTRRSDSETRILDDGTVVTLEAVDGCWVHIPDAALAVVTIGPGLIVDGDCDGIPDAPLSVGTSNFAAGIDSSMTPCPTIDETPTLDPGPMDLHFVETARDPPPLVCGDGIVNQPSEECDPPGSACPGGEVCQADCTCAPPPQGCCWSCLGNATVCAAPTFQADCNDNWVQGANCGTNACGLGKCEKRACCLGDGNCIDEISVTECDTMDGQPLAEGEGCQGDGDENGIDDACEVAIPTVSEWGLIVMTLVGLAMGTIMLGRRRWVAAAG